MTRTVISDRFDDPSTPPPSETLTYDPSTPEAKKLAAILTRLKADSGPFTSLVAVIHRDAKGRFASFGTSGGPVKSSPPSVKLRTILDDPDIGDHVRKVEALADSYIKAGKSTIDQHSTLLPDGRRRWTAERSALHDRIVDQIFADADAAGIPSQRRLFLMGGLPGSGKTTSLSAIDRPDVKPGKSHLVINPDDVKDLLYPHIELQPGLKRNEHAGLVHEESSYLTSMIVQRAAAEGRNVALDITMGKEEQVRKRLAPFAGYQKPEAMFVEVDVQTSLDRSGSRYKKKVDTPEGGRYVTPSFIMESDLGGGKTTNRATFDGLVKDGTIGRWTVVSNMGTVPVLLAQSRSQPFMPSTLGVVE